MMRNPLSGKRIPLPLNGRGWFKNLKGLTLSLLRKSLKADLVVVVLLLSVVLYAGTAVKMHSFAPFAPIATGSMEPEIGQGSMVVVKRVPASEIQKGDVIVFTVPDNVRPSGWPMRLAHRVVVVEKDPATGLVFATKGDALDSQDGFRTRADHVQGRVVYTIPVLGHIWLFLLSPPGLAFLALAAVAFLVYFTEAPVRRWWRQVTMERAQLADAVQTLVESRNEDREELRQFREAVANYGTHLQSHTKVMEGMAEMLERMNLVSEEIEERLDTLQVQNRKYPRKGRKGRKARKRRS